MLGGKGVQEGFNRESHFCPAWMGAAAKTAWVCVSDPERKQCAALKIFEISAYAEILRKDAIQCPELCVDWHTVTFLKSLSKTCGNVARRLHTPLEADWCLPTDLKCQSRLLHGLTRMRLLISDARSSGILGIHEEDFLRAQQRSLDNFIASLLQTIEKNPGPEDQPGSMEHFLELRERLDSCKTFNYYQAAMTYTQWFLPPRRNLYLGTGMGASRTESQSIDVALASLQWWDQIGSQNLVQPAGLAQQFPNLSVLDLHTFISVFPIENIAGIVEILNFIDGLSYSLYDGYAIRCLSALHNICIILLQLTFRMPVRVPVMDLHFLWQGSPLLASTSMAARGFSIFLDHRFAPEFIGAPMLSHFLRHQLFVSFSSIRRHASGAYWQPRFLSRMCHSCEETICFLSHEQPAKDRRHYSFRKVLPQYTSLPWTAMDEVDKYLDWEYYRAECVRRYYAGIHCSQCSYLYAHFLKHGKTWGQQPVLPRLTYFR